MGERQHERNACEGDTPLTADRPFSKGDSRATPLRNAIDAAKIAGAL
jgi:hypothetical protein